MLNKDKNMASTFQIVHHHLKPGMAGKWWSKTGAPMNEETMFAQIIIHGKRLFSTMPSCR